MAGTKIRTKALNWLASNFGVGSEYTRTSKFYIPEESWTRQSAWGFEIPLRFIESPESTEIHLVCEKEPAVDDCHYLKVQVEFFRKKLSNLYIRKNGNISLFLSAELDDLFVDRRGKDNVSFSSFLIS